MKVTPKGVTILLAVALLSFPAFGQTTPTPPPATSTPAASTAPQTTTPPAPAPAPKPPAAGPLQIKVNDNVNFRFGVLLQPQADFQENAQGGTQQNLMLRRVRFIVSGQLAPKAFFFFQTENSRLGGAIGTASKVISSGFQTIDADGEYRFNKAFNLWLGLIYLPTSREALKSSSSEFMIDTNTYAYTATTALAGTGGRDTGVMARGYFMKDKLEYRVGVFQGIREAGARNTFRKIARLQYELFDTEPYAFPSYQGAYFGTKKIVTVGASYDGQHNYKGPTADIFWDVPTGFGSTLGTVTVMRLDGKNSVTALPKSNIFTADAGIFFKGSKLGPWARYESRSFAAPNKSRNEKRYLGGLNYYPNGNSFNVKAAIGEFKPEVGRNQKQFTVQLQFFIY
jgi:phosphate-selective porin O/P